MNIIDLLLIVFVLLGIIKGYKKGLLNSLVGLCSSIIGLIVAINTHAYFVSWLEAQYQLTSKLSLYFQERLAISEAVSQLKLETLAHIDTSTAWEGLYLPDLLMKQLLDFSENGGGSMTPTAVVNVGDVLYVFLAQIVLKLLAIMIIWFLVNKGLCLLAHFFTNLTEDTFIGVLNKLGGVGVGFLIRVLVLTIIMGLCSPFFNIAQHTEPSFLSAVLKTISEAQLVPYFTSLFTVLTGQILLLW